MGNAGQANYAASKAGMVGMTKSLAMEAATRNVDTQRGDPSSMLHLYRRVLSERRASPALRLGDQDLRDGPEGTLIYERRAPDQRRLVLVNFTDGAIAVSARGTVVVASDGAGEGQLFTGVLQPAQAVVLAEE